MSAVDLARVGACVLKHAVTGEAVELRSLWQEQPCVVAGLRRFGCVVCRWIARDLSSLGPRLQQHGVRLVGVGPEAVGLREFLDGRYFAGELYLDETKRFYKELGFRRRLPRALSAGMGVSQVQQPEHPASCPGEAGARGGCQGQGRWHRREPVRRSAAEWGTTGGHQRWGPGAASFRAEVAG